MFLTSHPSPLPLLLQGAAPLLSSKSVLETAAGILAVEAYHGGAIRSELRDIANLVRERGGMTSVA
jgi:hypothetical protein